MKKEWYVVNTVSGYEYKVKEKLEMRINSMDLHENIFRVIVPEQKEIEYKNGVKKEKVDIFAVNNRVIEELKFQIKQILKTHRVIQEIDPNNCEDIETIKKELIDVIENEE